MNPKLMEAVNAFMLGLKLAGRLAIIMESREIARIVGDGLRMSVSERDELINIALEIVSCCEGLRLGEFDVKESPRGFVVTSIWSDHETYATLTLGVSEAEHVLNFHRRTKVSKRPQEKQPHVQEQPR